MWNVTSVQGTCRWSADLVFRFSHQNLFGSLNSQKEVQVLVLTGSPLTLHHNTRTYYLFIEYWGPHKCSYKRVCVCGCSLACNAAPREHTVTQCGQHTHFLSLKRKQPGHVTSLLCPSSVVMVTTSTWQELNQPIKTWTCLPGEWPDPESRSSPHSSRLSCNL